MLINGALSRVARITLGSPIQKRILSHRAAGTTEVYSLSRMEDVGTLMMIIVRFVLGFQMLRCSERMLTCFSCIQHQPCSFDGVLHPSANSADAVRYRPFGAAVVRRSGVTKSDHCGEAAVLKARP